MAEDTPRSPHPSGVWLEAGGRVLVVMEVFAVLVSSLSIREFPQLQDTAALHQAAPFHLGSHGGTFGSGRKTVLLLLI